MNKPSAIAGNPFITMRMNTIKERSYYTQGQRFAARILFIVWLLASLSTDSTLAAPDGQPAMTPPMPLPGGALQLPLEAPGAFWGGIGGSSPAVESALQQRMSQKAALDPAHELLSTSPKANPVSEHFSFDSRGGEQVRFSCQQGQWHAEVSSHIGAFSRRSVLPVVCCQGTDVTSSLAVLSRYPSWYSQRQIHVLDENGCPTLRKVVYVGSLGLKGGNDKGKASGSGGQEGAPPSLARSSLDYLQEQVVAGKSPEEVYPLIGERLADPEKTFSRTDQVRLLTDCVRYGQVNAKALSDKDVIVVLGNTGSGKSTFVNYLAGCQLEEKWIEGQLEPVLEVLSTASGGERDEVAPIGHSVSKTFIPQIVAVDRRVYCDCPGFRDNRGPEISIANAVNIKQALSQAQSLRMVVLVNYHSLLADRANSFRESLSTLEDLLGSEAAISTYQESLLLGISKCPGGSTREQLRKGIAPHIPESLSFLKDRLFVFNPLSPEAGWDRTGCLGALDGLAPVTEPSSILSVSLSDSDKNALHGLGGLIEDELADALSKDNVGTASSCLRCLERLSVLEHEAINQLRSSIQIRISSWLKDQESEFLRLYAKHDFPGAEKLLETLDKAVASFDSSDLDISSLRAELDSAREAYEAHQAQVSSLEAEKSQLQSDLAGQQASHAQALSALAAAKSQLQSELAASQSKVEELQEELTTAAIPTWESVISASVWERYFGEVGVEPPLPDGIARIMNSPCPFWNGKKVKDTHLLTLIPSHVGGKPLTLDYLGELMRSPKEGHRKAHYDSSDSRNEFYWKYVSPVIGQQSPGSPYWFLMTRRGLNGSGDKSYADQCQLIADHANRTGLPYEVPRALEAVVVTLLHYVKSGTDLSWNPSIFGRIYRYTRCQEQAHNFQVEVKRFVDWGEVQIGFSWHGDFPDTGVVAVRRFRR